MRWISILVLSTSISGCAAKYSEFPHFDDGESEYAVAVGHFVSGIYLPENPFCGSSPSEGIEVICMDPPPMALRFEVSDSLFGPPIPKRIVTFSTSHFGKDGLDFGIDHPYLVLLKTNGEEYVTPRYRMEPLAWDVRDQLAIPLDSPSDSIYWLPCEVSQPATEIRFAGPRKLIRFNVEHLSEEELQEMQGFVRVYNDSAAFQRGVYVDEIQRRMVDLDSSQIAEGCRM